jgi:DNA repair protein RadC
MLLDRRNRVLEIVDLYKGSVNSSQIGSGRFSSEAVRKNASAIIVIHNHPAATRLPAPTMSR